jgi:hypothetical protein
MIARIAPTSCPSASILHRFCGGHKGGDWLISGFRIGERPVSVPVIEAVLSRHLEDLEPRLTRHGYTLRSLVEQFSAKPAEIRQFLRGELSGAKAQELSERMRAAGLPV